MSLKRSFFALLLIFLSGIPFAVTGQLDGKFVDASQDPALPFTITRYGTMHGLPQNQVTDIVAKKNGSLILSTANGIVEFNGNAFVPFVRDEEYNKKLHVRLFWNEEHGKLFGSELSDVFNGIHPEFSMVYRFSAAALVGNTLFGISIDGEILRRDVNGGPFSTIARTGLKDCNWMYSEEGHHYVSNQDGLYHIDEKTGKKNLLVQDEVWHIRRNPYSGKLYAVSYQKPVVYEILSDYGVRKVNLQHDLPMEDLHFTDLAFVSADQWFLGTNSGLICVSPEGTQSYGRESHFPSVNLLSLHYDKQQKCLFVGTSLDGFLVLQLKSCRSYFDPSGIGESSLGSIVSDDSGCIYIAGSEGIIYTKTPEGIRPYHQCAFAVASLAVLDNDLYAGTWGGAVRIIRNGKEIDSIRNSQVNNQSVHSIFRDSRGQLWLGLGHGISTGKTPGDVHHILPWIDECIITFCELRDGTVCAGGTQHIFFFSPDGKVLKSIGKKDGLVAKETRAFYEDREGKLWIGTYDGGLYCYENGKLTSINQLPGCLLQPDVFTLARDNGYLLMTSNKGLWSVSERRLNDFYRGRIPYLVPFYYGEESGIRNTEFNGGMQNNYLRTGPGTFFFPTIKGLVFKQPDALLYRELSPQWLSLYVNDRPHHLDDNAFSRETHTVRFNFFCPIFSRKFNLHYQYKLTGPGLPDSWSPLQKEGRVEFKMLPPGKYRLSVRAIDGFNDASPKVLTYAFEIVPHFYETPWFKSLGIIVVVLLTAALFGFLYRRKLARSTRENKISNTILELKLQAIQSKMDPHFIFNALNNIIYLLNAEKYVEAEELVHDFSLLLRRFLEKSDSIFLTVEEELGIIDLYLLIEQKRFNPQFSYHIAIADDVRRTEIPTLLIQPLIENAVKHGISHADRTCMIDIRAVAITDGVEITITDDGIGLEAAKRINANRKDHVSKGLEIVRGKIAIMEEKYGMEILLEVMPRADATIGTISRLVIRKP